MLKKKDGGEAKAPKEKKPGRFVPWLKGLPGAFVQGLKDMAPQPNLPQPNPMQLPKPRKVGDRYGTTW